MGPMVIGGPGQQPPDLTPLSLDPGNHHAFVAGGLVAQPGDHGKPEKSQKYKKHEQRHEMREEHQPGRSKGPATDRQRMHSREPARVTDYNGAIQIGGYFREPQREAARDYYDRPENRGFC